MRQLNEAESNLLLTCAADGAVRIWRSYLNAGNQRMATAWQAVPITQDPLPHLRPSAYALTSAPYSLFAVGGSHPDVLHQWDLASEMCMYQVGGLGGCATSDQLQCVHQYSIKPPSSGSIAHQRCTMVSSSRGRYGVFFLNGALLLLIASFTTDFGGNTAVHV